MMCRHCQKPVEHNFLDLGHAPPSNAYLTSEDLSKPEVCYPLRVTVCGSCWLVQTEDYARAEELFKTDYAYFSSTSTSWLEHAKRFAEFSISEFALGTDSLVIEVASNDGYLLKNYLEAGVPCLGIEPTAGTADAAVRLGINVWREFFGEKIGLKLAAAGHLADLIVGNNVYAHVPDINDFTLGLKAALKPGGVVSLEFPHIKNLIEKRQFDTVYHEHFSYLSLGAVVSIFNKAGLKVWNVVELDTHGGSLRVFGCHSEDPREVRDAVNDLLSVEYLANLYTSRPYLEFQQKTESMKYDLIQFLIEKKRNGDKVVAFGAAAKGNTFLNYAGIKSDLLAYVCDSSPAKQGKYMPGSHIPIVGPDRLRVDRPDFVLILPWNLRQEVMSQIGFISDWGGRFVVAIPQLSVS